jgi:hypothetical protein
MTNQERNGRLPAFEYSNGETTAQTYWEAKRGLSKREYFAAMAMQSMVAGPGAQMVADRDQRYDGSNWKEVVAMNAIEFADELLKQLE